MPKKKAFKYKIRSFFIVFGAKDKEKRIDQVRQAEWKGRMNYVRREIKLSAEGDFL